MATSKKALRDAIRAKYIELVGAFLSEQGEEVLTVDSNKIAFPCLDSEENEEFIVLTFSVPTGTRDDKKPYDGYAMAEDYRMKCEAKAEKAKEAQAKKEAKIARDKARREKGQ